MSKLSFGVSGSSSNREPRAAVGPRATGGSRAKLLATTALWGAVIGASVAYAAPATLPVTDTPTTVSAVQTANGQPGDTIQLANSIALTQTLQPLTSAVTFDSNGFTLTGMGNQALVLETGPSVAFLGSGVFSGPVGGVATTTMTGATVTNASTLTSQNASTATIYFVQPGTLSNSGAITGDVGAIWATTGAVTNTGSITGTLSSGVYIQGSDTTLSTASNSGRITGVLNGLGIGGIGVVTNSGSITSASGSGVSLDSDGNATGLSVLNNNAGGVISGVQEGVYLHGAGATVNNAAGASISGSNGNAIYALHGATITNGGAISSGATTGYDAIYVTGGGSLSNSGAISGGGASVQFNGSATVTNASTGTITGNSGSAIYIKGTGALTNAGALISTGSEAVAILQGGTINNTGLIQGTFGGAQLGTGSFPNGGTLTNSGTIQATLDGGNGATLIGANSVVNNNAGGLIASTQTVGSGSWGLDFEGNTETLTNAGTIKGDVGVVFDGSGALVNAAGASIIGATTGVASGLGGASGAVTLTSAGLISGGTTAIALTGAYANTLNLQAGSTTTGLISTGVGNDSLTLAGTSTGGVNLGGGNNTLTLVGGANAGGTLDGGTGGTNALILTGSTSGSVTASQLADFATVTKTGTGTWFVNGPNALAAPWTIQQGTVQITDVTGVGTAAVVDNSELSLFGVAGTFSNAVSGAGALRVTGVAPGSTLTFTGNLTNSGAADIASLIVFDASHIAVAGTNTSGNIGVDLQGANGTLDVLSGASITSAGLGVQVGQGGTVNNAGTIRGANGNAIYAVGDATLVNTGTLSGAGVSYDAIYVTGGGSLTNSGAITGTGAAVQFNGSATVTNSAAGVITGGTGSAIYIKGSGTLSNAGALVSTGSAAVAILQGGAVTNTGSISGTFEGVQLGSGSAPNGGTLTNSGTIQATQDGGNGATLLGANSVVTNTAGGVIASTLTAGSGSYGVDFEGANATLTNAGTIKADVAVVFDGGGVLNNSATGVISGVSTGVVVNGVTTVNNAGIISGQNGVLLQTAGTVNNLAGGAINGQGGNAIAASSNVTIVNAGALTSAAGSGYDAVFGAAGGTLTNTGTIKGDGAAVQFTQAATITNAAGGSIAGGSGSAIYVAADATIVNQGTLTSAVGSGVNAVDVLGGGSLTNSGVITGDFIGVQFGTPATVTNSGAITGVNSRGVYLSSGGTVTNTGTITGAGRGVVLVGSGTVVNSGTITGTGTGAYSIRALNGANSVVTLNAGSISNGLVSAEDNGDSVTSAGVVNGGISVLGANATVNLVSGTSVTGAVSGSGANDGLILSGAGAGAIAGSQLSGFATATKIGTGAWALTGSNGALTSGFSVQQGVLSFADDSALGAGTLTIAGGAEVQATATTQTTRAVTIAGTAADIDVAAGATYGLGGVVSGAAGTSLNVNNGGGAGVLAFTANNATTLASDINLYAGTIYAGVTGALGTGALHVFDPDLVIGNGVTVTNPIDLHATLTVQSSGSGGISGVVSESTVGSGLIKTGTGTLSLSGVNTYTGATTISSGTLALVGAGSIATSSGVVDNGALDISGATSGASIKSLSGAGSVALGAQTLTLTNASDTFSGAISGSGGVTFAGGTETLTGTSTYTGPTVVSGGALVLNGALTASTIMVVGGGSVQGSGSIANIAIAAGSTLSPGGANGLGQVSPTGNLTLAPGAIYQVTANAQGQSDLVTVGGKATLAGAVVQVQAQSGTFARNTPYTILTAAGGLSGAFAGVTSNFAFLTPSLAYTGNAVNLLLSNNGVAFQTLAQTPNQAAVATALYASNPSGALYNAILVQSDTGARQAFNALSGQLYATVPTVLLNQSHYVRDALLGRMRQEDDQATAGAGPTANDLGNGPLHLTAWGQIIGAWSQGGAQAGGISPTDTNTGGGILGVDGAVSRWRVGVAVAQLDTNINLADSASHESVESSNVAIYASGPIVAALKARAGFNYAWDALRSGRTVDFPGFAERVGAHYGSQTEDGFGELGYDLNVGHVAVEPYANLAYVRVNTDSLRESGGIAALQAPSSAVDGVFSDVGFRTGTQYQIADRVAFQPYINLGWRHVYSGTQTTAALAFENTGTAFVVNGAALDRDAGLVEAGFVVNMGFRAKLTAAYIGQISSHWQDHQAKLDLSLAF
jgi:uncharacterized protein with beta-barrel porin domain